MFRCLEVFGWRPDEFMGMDPRWQVYAMAYVVHQAEEAAKVRGDAAWQR